jgi:hypothetical protein
LPESRFGRICSAGSRNYNCYHALSR